MPHLGLMLCDFTSVLQASGFDGVDFDPFSFHQDGLTAPELDVGWRQVAVALVLSEMVAVGDDVADLLLEISKQVVDLEQDAVVLISRDESSHKEPRLISRSCSHMECWD